MSVVNDALKKALEQKNSLAPSENAQAAASEIVTPAAKEKPGPARWVIMILSVLFILAVTAAVSLYISRNSEIAERIALEDQLSQKNQELEELRGKYADLEQQKAEVEKQYNLDSLGWQTAEKEYKDKLDNLGRALSVRAGKNKALVQANRRLELDNKVNKTRAEKLFSRIRDLEKQAQANSALSVIKLQKDSSS